MTGAAGTEPVSVLVMFGSTNAVCFMPAGDMAPADIAMADAMGALCANDVMAKIITAGASWSSLLLGAPQLMCSMARADMLLLWLHLRD